MFDSAARRLIAPPLNRAAQWLDHPWVTPNRLSVAGLILGLSSAVLAAAQEWWWALACWGLCRLADGLDGALARHRRGGRPDTGQGGFVDIVVDFASYGATVVGVAFGATSQFGVAWWPFLLVLFAYYVNGTAFLAFSSIAERRRRTIDDGRSLSFTPSLTEGTETVAVHALWLVIPQFSAVIAVVWSVAVLISAGQRIVGGYRRLA